MNPVYAMRIFRLTFITLLVSLMAAPVPLLAADSDFDERLIQVLVRREQGHSGQAIELANEMNDLEKPLGEPYASRGSMLLLGLVDKIERFSDDQLIHAIRTVGTSEVINPILAGEASWLASLSALHKAEPADRAELWERLRAPLMAVPYVDSHGSRKVLDALNVELAEERLEFDLLDQILCYAVLCAENVQTMSHIQHRRIALLEQRGLFADAARAAILEVLIASSTKEGPLAATKRLEAIAKGGRLSKDDTELVQQFIDRFFFFKSTDASELPYPIDQRIGDHAAVFLEQHSKAPGDAIWLQRLLAGEAESAERLLASLVSADSSPQDGDWVQQIVLLHTLIHQRQAELFEAAARFESGEATASENDVTSVEITLSGFSDQLRYTQWLRSTLMGWLQGAVEAGVPTVEKYAYSSLLNTMQHGDTRAAMAEAIAVERSRQLGAGKDAVAWLVILSDTLSDTQDKHQVLNVAARAQLDSKAHERCLEIVEQIDRLEGASDRRDFETELSRTLSLISLDRINEAKKNLERIRSWRGEPEQEAFMRFLNGWIHLREGDNKLALGYFRVVVDQYPNSQYAQKAREMLLMLESQ